MLFYIFSNFLLLGLLPPVGAEPVVKDETNDVTYRGITADSVEHFMGIRFAHDTSGSRRFAPPEAYVPEKGSTIDATTPGPACAQSRAGVPPFYDETADISEDCLTLRIARPKGTSRGANLPVVVYVVEGGVVKGSSHDRHNDPQKLISLSIDEGKPVIYVAVQSRLTIFGFATLEILKGQKSLNAGMRDQRAGLQWVKDHIAEFGGDPDRITAFGLSAGATMTALQLVSYEGSQGVPFSQAWLMSGPPGTSFNMSDTQLGEVHTLNVAETVGCKHEEEAEILDCLRALPMDRLLDAAVTYATEYHPPIGLFTFIPSVDGVFFPDRQSRLVRDGKFVKGVPMVLGWTQDEGDLQTGPPSMHERESDIIQTLRTFTSAFDDQDYEKLFALYPASDFEADVARYQSTKKESDPEVPVHWFRASRMMRDILFTCSSVNFGYEMYRQSREIEPSFENVRLYMLGQTMLKPLFEGAGMPYLGTVHGSDMSYILGGVFPEGEVTASDQELSVAFVKAFLSFAYTGNPSFTSKGEDEGFGAWVGAFTEPPSSDENLGTTRGPSSLNLQVIGGSSGSRLHHLHDSGGEAVSGEAGLDSDMGQQVVFGEMQEPELARQKLFSRCAFINGLSEKLNH